MNRVLKSINTKLTKLIFNKYIFVFILILLFSNIIIYYYFIHLQPELIINSYYQNATAQEVYPFTKLAKSTHLSINLLSDNSTIRKYRVVYELPRSSLTDISNLPKNTTEIITADDIYLLKQAFNWKVINYSSYYITAINGDNIANIKSDLLSRNNLPSINNLNLQKYPISYLIANSDEQNKSMDDSYTEASKLF